MHPSRFGGPSYSRSSQHEARRAPIYERDVRARDPATEGALVKLTTNAYSVRRKANHFPVHQYQLVISLSVGYRHLPDKTLARSSVSRSLRQLLNDKIIPQLLSPTQSKASIVIDHNLTKVYTIGRLEKRNETPSCSSIPNDEFQFYQIPVDSDMLSGMSVDIFIKYQNEIRDDDESELMTTVLHHNLLLDMVKFGSSYYQLPESWHTRSHDSWDELDLIARHSMGMSVSGLKHCTNKQSLVVISCVHSYMTQSHRLIDLLASFLFGCPTNGLSVIQLGPDSRFVDFRRVPQIEAIDGHERWWQSFQVILKNYKFRAHGPEGMVNLRFGLSDAPAAVLTMTDPATNAQVIVRDYFESHGFQIAYPNLPCLYTRHSRCPYYPLELCTLISGQKVPIFRLATAASEHMIALNKVRPTAAKTSSSRARDTISHLNQEHFSSFAIELSKHPSEATGSILRKPILKFGDGHFSPKNEFWESGVFYESINLVGNWCVVNTAPVDSQREDNFFREYSQYCTRHGFRIDRPLFINKSKQQILDDDNSIVDIIKECFRLTNGKLKFVMFVIDSKSTQLIRLVHLCFEDHPDLTSACLRVDSIMNFRQQRAIFRTLVHKLNTRLGGTNVTYDFRQIEKTDLKCNELLIIGLDVTHPDNELNDVSIVGCAYTYGADLFKHRSLVWPQQARVEIISKLGDLMRRLINEYLVENKQQLPKYVIVYRDGVSHEDFDKVLKTEVAQAQEVLTAIASNTLLPKPNLNYIIAQKRHRMRFFKPEPGNPVQLTNPQSGTLIDRDVVAHDKREFYLYSSTNPQSTSRPLHYYALLNGMDIETLQKLTYSLCFNFGKCSATLSMPSSLKYAHNAAYDARNRVIAAREFSETQFYSSKFFC